MAARQTRLTLAVVAALAVLADSVPTNVTALSAAAPRRAQSSRPVTRIVSLVPALTEMLFAIGAGSRVVGVSNFDSFPPQVKTLPRVGALLDPDTERILTLHPDFVITYGSQTDVQARFERAGVQVFSYRHTGIDGVLMTLRQLGQAVGHAQEADTVARRVEQRLDAIRERVKGRPRPRTLLVFERTPLTLRGVYASGGTGFVNDMLDAAGADNVFEDVTRESVQPSQEVLLTRAPAVIVEIRANDIPDINVRRRDHAVWDALSSVPAVRQHRVYFLTGDQLVVPGPRVADGVEMIARAIHPEAFK